LKTMELRDVQRDPATLVEKIRAGEEILLVEGGEPLARLVPCASRAHCRIPDRYAGQIVLPSDLEDTPVDIIDEFERGGLD
jgi:antitoxin (DNA-binding transcriptional repressor) of toxin-antitoxin stability system